MAVPRPKEADSAKTYETIVSCARELIAEDYAHFSLRRVSDRSGQSLGAINYYFENRQGLVEACLEECYAWMDVEVNEALQRIAAGGDWRREVDSFVRRLFVGIRENQQLVRSRLASTMQEGALPERRLSSNLLPLLDNVSSVLGGSEAGKSAVRELRFAAHTLELIVTRYALHTDEEIRRIAGQEVLSEALESVQSHLVGLCVGSFERGIPS